MITIQHQLDQLARRIETAYSLRHPNWSNTGITPGVWNAAAIRLFEAGAAGRTMPLDPELYVAVQNYRSFRRDPWVELAQEGSAKAYRIAIRDLVAQLRAELKTELRWSAHFLKVGGSLDELLTTPQSRVSPLAAMSLFIRHERFDLVDHVRNAARSQHQACPLYRLACKRTIPAAHYPMTPPVAPADRTVADQRHSFAWN